MNDSDRSCEPAYRLAVEQFNREQFHASHTTWESLWQADRTGPNADYYKGLIQAAMALYHLRKGNLAGARKLVARAAKYLAAFAPHHLGLDVDQFLAALAGCVAAVTEDSLAEPGTSGSSLRFPKIVLRPSRSK